MSASTVYISASTNRYHHCGHCAPGSSLVVFGSHKFVALWDTGDARGHGVYATLPGHKGEITCARFAGDDALLTADDTGDVIVWTRSPTAAWAIAARVKAHERAVSALGVHAQTGVVVSGSSDAKLKVWNLRIDGQSATMEQAQDLDLRGRYALDVQLDMLPESSALVMAIGTTDRNVSIWTRSEGQPTDVEFIHALALPGHDDWVRSLSFASNVEPDALTLASGSQDGTIRLWQFTSVSAKPDGQNEDAADELLDAFEASLDDVGDGAEGGRQISLKRHVLSVKAEDNGARIFHVTFDALLVGHEAGVTSVAWSPSSPTLLSTSTDSSVILWRAEPISGLWINAHRFGDIGGQKLGGFVGGLWAGQATHEALAWGWTGGWRRWRQSDAQRDRWEETLGITGHQGPVRGLSWSPDGAYLISASYDQSSRIHGPVGSVWHELGRPQVHGYDLIAAAFVDPLRFVSVADERVARVFDAPQRFTTLLQNLGTTTTVAGVTEARPVAASVPPLGLSNKAAADDAAETSTDNLSRVPFEGELASRTLWPEANKIFGHGYELIAIGASHAGDLIATACKASTAEHAVVRVYDAKTWQPAGSVLEGHALTVTRVRWSPDDRFILTVSRDRSWRLFGPRTADNLYPPCASTPRSHARIIWDCAWSNEGDFFVTVARDKTTRIWSSVDNPRTSWTEVGTIKLDDAGTAVDLLPTRAEQHTYMAVGLENGHVRIYTAQRGVPSKWTLFAKLDSSIASVDQIYQLAWRPGVERSGQAGERPQLALCSEDRTLRLIDVRLD